MGIFDPIYVKIITHENCVFEEQNLMLNTIALVYTKELMIVSMKWLLLRQYDKDKCIWKEHGTQKY